MEVPEFEKNATGQPGDEEPAPKWYTPARIKAYTGISIAFIVLTMAPLVGYLIYQDRALDWLKTHPTLMSLWVFVATLSYPVWTWIEVVYFEKWVRGQPADRRPIERAYFKLNSDLAKNFWTAMFGVYAAAGVVGLALKGH